MATIPLAIADPLDQAQKAQSLVTGQAGLKSLLQQQQLQGQQIQQNQLNLNDQKAMSDAMHQWDGQDINDLPGLMIKTGASAGAVIGMKQHILDFSKQQADIAVAQGNAGKIALDNKLQQNQNVADSMGNAVIKNKDGTINQDATAQAIEVMGHNRDFVGNLSPGEQQQWPAIAAHFKGLLANDPQDFEDQWDQARKEHLAQSQQYKMASDQLSLLESQQKTTNTAADIAARNAWLSANPGKTAADWEAKKAADLAQAQEGGKLQADTNALGGVGTTQPMADAKYRFLQAQKAQGQPLAAPDQAFVTAYEKQKTLEAQTQFNLQNGGVTGQNGQPSAIAQGLANGTMKWQDVVSVRTPMSVKEQLLSEVKSIKPDYNSGDFDVEQRVKQTATSGAVGQQLLAIGTARQHMQVFSQLADALNNGDNQALNKIGNALGVQFGSDKATNLKIAAQAFGGEVGRAFDGAGVTAGEREQAESAYSAALSKGQFKGAVETVDKLLAGKQKAAHDWFDQGMQAKPDFGTTGAARKGSASATPAAGAARVGQKISIKGKQMTVTKVYPNGSFDAK